MGQKGMPPSQVFAKMVSERDVELPALARLMRLPEFHAGELLNGRSMITDADAQAIGRATDTEEIYWLQMQKDYIQALADGVEFSINIKKFHYHRFVAAGSDFLGMSISVFNTRMGTEMSIESRKVFFPDLVEYAAICEVSDCWEIESLIQNYQATTDEDEMNNLSFEEVRAQKSYMEMFEDFNSALFIMASKWKIRKLGYPNVLSCTIPQIGTDGDYRSLYIIRPALTPKDFDASKWLKEGYLLTDLGELYGNIIVNNGRDEVSITARALIDKLCQEYAPWVESISYENGMLNMVTKSENLAFAMPHYMNVTSAVAALMEFVHDDAE